MTEGKKEEESESGRGWRGDRGRGGGAAWKINTVNPQLKSRRRRVPTSFIVLVSPSNYDVAQ